MHIEKQNVIFYLYIKKIISFDGFDLFFWNLSQFKKNKSNIFAFNQRIF